MRVAALHFHGDPVVGSAEMHLSALNIFFGANGVGKTHILNSIARTLKRDEYERNRSTGYYNHLRIFWHLDIRDGASTGSPQVGSSTNDERLIWRILQPVNDFRGSSAYSRDDVSSFVVETINLYRTEDPRTIDFFVNRDASDLFGIESDSERQPLLERLSKSLVLAYEGVGPEDSWAVYGSIPKAELVSLVGGGAIANYLPDLGIHESLGAPVFSSLKFGHGPGPQVTELIDSGNNWHVRSTQRGSRTHKPGFYVYEDSVWVPLFGYCFGTFVFELDSQGSRLEFQRHREVLNDHLPYVLKPEINEEDFSRDLERAIDAIATVITWDDRLLDSPSQFSWGKSQIAGKLVVRLTGGTYVDGVGLTSGRFSAGYLADKSWVIGATKGDIADSITVAGMSGTRFRISPAIQRAIELVEQESANYLPSFIKERYELRIEVVHPDYWSHFDCRSLPFLVDRADSSNVISVQSASSGIRRWCQIAIRIASEGILNGHRISLDDELEYLAAARDVNDSWAISFELNTNETMLLIDEPESNLHPLGLMSVRSLMEEVAVGSSGVFAATHSTHLFDVSSLLASKFVLGRGAAKQSVVHQWTDDASSLNDWAAEIGISPGELYLLSKIFLLVEGAHDAAVLKEWFSEQFSRLGVKCIPVHGDDNLKAVAVSQIVIALGKPVVALFDRPMRGSTQRDAFERQIASENRRIEDLENEAASEGHPRPWGLLKVQTATLDKFDIWFYLDESLVIEELRPAGTGVGGPLWEFDTWRDALDRYEEQTPARERSMNGKKGFKRFLMNQQGINPTAEQVRRIAIKQKNAGLIPLNLARIVDRILDESIS